MKTHLGITEPVLNTSPGWKGGQGRLRSRRPLSCSMRPATQGQCQGGHESREHIVNHFVCSSFSTKLLIFSFLLTLAGSLRIFSYAHQCRNWEWGELVQDHTASRSHSIAFWSSWNHAKSFSLRTANRHNSSEVNYGFFFFFSQTNSPTIWPWLASYNLINFNSDYF